MHVLPRLCDISELRRWASKPGAKNALGVYIHNWRCASFFFFFSFLLCLCFSCARMHPKGHVSSRRDVQPGIARARSLAPLRHRTDVACWSRVSSARLHAVESAMVEESWQHTPGYLLDYTPHPSLFVSFFSTLLCTIGEMKKKKSLLALHASCVLVL